MNVIVPTTENLNRAYADATRHGKIGVSVMTNGGFMSNINEHDKFRAASVVKIPLMIAAYRQIETGANRAGTQIFTVVTTTMMVATISGKSASDISP